jgi:hypothetical protein
VDDKMYKDVLGTLVVQKGHITRGDTWFWGASHDADYFVLGKHLRACGWIVSNVDEEFTWDEFAGTFASGTDKRHGIKIQVSCKCGQIKDRGMLYEKTTGEAIRDVLDMAEIMFNKKTENQD